MRDTGWIKSTRSTSAGENCVEVRIADTTTGVRDSKNPTGDRLILSRRAFDSLVAGIITGR